MKNLNNEILNKYIDNDLTQTELENLTKIISQKPEALKELKAQELVEKSLKKIELLSAPKDFTQKIMSKIFEKHSFSTHSRKFFYIINIAFFTIFTASLALFFSQQQSFSTSNTFEFINNLNSYIAQKIAALKPFFNKINLLLIWEILIFILSVTLFFIIDSHKKFKKHFQKLF